MRFPASRLLAALLLALAIAAAAAILASPPMVARVIRQAAARRGLVASFDRPRLTLGPGVRLAHFVAVQAASGDTALAADSLDARVSVRGLLTFHLEPVSLSLAHARVRLAGAGEADLDTLPPVEEPRHGGRRPARSDRPERVRAFATEVVRTLLLPARTLPRLDLRDVRVTRIAGGDTVGARIERLMLGPERGGVRLAAAGVLDTEGAIPFVGTLRYGRDDRLVGAWRFGVPDPRAGRTWPVELAVDARLHQDRRRGRVELREPSTLRIGAIAIRLDAALAREGPSLDLDLAADSLDDAKLRASLPPPVLGPLAQVGTRGRWDYRLSFDLDLTRPDSVRFVADVIPHGLALDPARTRLGLLTLDQPFVAAIHLPHERIVTRDLSPANPHFRTYDEIDSLLVHAVVTNEDGGFFRHRGFNTEAVKGAIADDIRAGSFRRGAGTITMQLARNLWLGHARTLARKWQEVALAWILENLAGVSKRRLLEIYLNIIEWGPDVHGADEAARYYFGHDAGRLSVDEALFLTTVVPAPTKWRWRFDASGELREFERAQMHFIGRAMIAKGWLAPDELPAPEALHVEIRGPARDVLFPPAGESASGSGNPRASGPLERSALYPPVAPMSQSRDRFPRPLATEFATEDRPESMAGSRLARPRSLTLPDPREAR